MTAASRSVPLLAALGAAICWGIWWIPIRALEEAGLTGSAAVTGMSLGAIPVLSLLLLRSRGGWPGFSGAIGAIMMGLAVILYGFALTQTEVVRAIMLFYLAPAWSIGIECLFLGRRWVWRSGAALAFSLAGLLIIMRGDISLSAFNAGDLAAFGSGFAWAVGSAFVFTGRWIEAPLLTILTMCGAVVAGTVLGLLEGSRPDPTVQDALDAFIWGTIYVAPVMLATVWGALRLGPATLSFLLTAEIVSGVISAAIFLDERFGWPEAVGAVFIALGGLTEVLLGKPAQRASPETDHPAI